jgi:hypothetical protein
MGSWQMAVLTVVWAGQKTAAAAAAGMVGVSCCDGFGLGASCECINIGDNGITVVAGLAGLGGKRKGGGGRYWQRHDYGE